MSGAEIAAVVIVLIMAMAAIAAAVVVPIAVFRRHAAKKAALAAMSPAERAAHDAELQHAADVKQATKERDAREKEHRAAVAAAEKAVARAQRIGRQTVATLKAKGGSVRLSPLTIAVRGAAHDVTESLHAVVDADGNVAVDRRTTATRVLGGALVAGPVGAVVGATAKKKRVSDFRELYVTITGEDFVEVLSCDPSAGEAARKFAAAVNTAALNVASVRAQREAAMAQASAHLAAVRRDTAAADAARARLAALTDAPARIGAEG